MKNRIPLKKDFSPPSFFDHPLFRLEVLSPHHNELDWEAWNSSKESLQGIFGPRNPWPNDAFNLDKNLKDLEKHYKEFEDKIAFTYSILNPGGDSCIGCLYIKPSQSKQFECRVVFWFRDSKKEVEDEFFQWLKNWLNESWNLKKPVFTGREVSWEDYYKNQS